MHYVMSDIHGCVRQLDCLLEKLNLGPGDRLFVAGDLIDRGPAPMEVVRLCMETPNIEVIKGNHEGFFTDNVKGMGEAFYQGGVRDSCWLDWNGGRVTYGRFLDLKRERQEEVVRYLMSLPLYKTLTVKGKRYVLVHAGFGADFSERRPMRSYCEEDLLWYRTRPREPLFRSRTAVMGHTPTMSLLEYVLEDYMEEKGERVGSLWRLNLSEIRDEGYRAILESCIKARMVRYPDRIYIDCGCVFGGNLGCLCLETQEEVYVKGVERKQ